MSEQSRVLATSIVSTIDELRTMYREPSSLVRAKIRAEVDPAVEEFVALTRLVMVSTIDADGRLDVSPRGGPAGFIRVVDGHVLIPDLNGNNLLDTLTNVVLSGRVGLLFIRPGLDETVRINGRAWITTAPDVLSSFTAELRTPKCALVVEPDEVFIHCAKAFRRGDVWAPDQWVAGGPDGTAILACQFGFEDDAAIREKFARGINADLAADRPGPVPS